MKLARPVLWIVVLAWVLLLVGGPGYRLGLWGLGFGLLGVMRYAMILGVIGAGLAIVLLLLPRSRRERGGTLLAALLLGLAVVAVPVYVRQSAQSLPAIHDITTDTEVPPRFVDALALRVGVPNPPEYAGNEVAAQQLAAYPDIQPLLLDRPPAAVFDAALDTARELGWEIIASVPEQGRIEAVDTTLWYGFRDDVVIRIQADGEASRVDVRSKSRVGRSDLGANAARIREFLNQLE